MIIYYDSVCAQITSTKSIITLVVEQAAIYYHLNLFTIGKILLE
jgi:hypothetical protein